MKEYTRREDRCNSNSSHGSCQFRVPVSNNYDVLIGLYCLVLGIQDIQCDKFYWSLLQERDVGVAYT